MVVKLNPATIVILILLTIQPSFAASYFAHLGIPQGARETSMGETSVSINGNGSEIWWNPAHISSNQTSMWMQTFHWFVDGKGSYGGFSVPSRWGGFSAYYMNHIMEGYEARDNPGPSQGDFTLRQSLLAAGGAVNLLRNMSFGFAIKQAIEVFQGRRAKRSNIFDIGLNWQLDKYSVGFAAANVVFDEKKDENLPFTLRSGLSYYHNIDDYNIVLAYGGDLRRPSEVDKEDDFELINKFGLEIGWSEMLFGRLGCMIGDDSQNISYGVGVIAQEIYQFDFAVVPSKYDLGTTWKMGLGIVF